MRDSSVRLAALRPRSQPLMLAKFASLPFDEWQGPCLLDSHLLERRNLAYDAAEYDFAGRHPCGLGLRKFERPGPAAPRAAGAARRGAAGAAARSNSVASRRARHQGGAQNGADARVAPRPDARVARVHGALPQICARVGAAAIRRRAAALPAQADPASGDAGLGGADGAPLRRRLLPQRERAQLLGAARRRRRAPTRSTASRRRAPATTRPLSAAGRARRSASTATAAATTPPPTTRRRRRVSFDFRVIPQALFSPPSEIVRQRSKHALDPGSAKRGYYALAYPGGGGAAAGVRVGEQRRAWRELERV